MAVKVSVSIRSLSIILIFSALLLPGNLSAQTAKKKSSAHHSKKKVTPTSSPGSAKLRHVTRAFVASADLKPMAQQLLENRTPQGYAGIEEYAAAHSKDDAGPLAWLVIGYARYLDKNYASAREAWVHAAPLEPVLGDYLDFLRASAFQGEQNPAEVIKVLDGFEQKYPASLNQHDVTMLYAGALVSTGEPQRAIAYLEKHRQPLHASLELMLARAYEAAGGKEKVQDILRRIYFEMPVSQEADAAAQELRALGEAPPVGDFGLRHARVEVLLKARRFQDAANDLSSLVEVAPPEKIVGMQGQFGTALYRIRKREDAQRLFENIFQNKSATVEEHAKALYYLAESARDKEDFAKNAAYLIQLRSLAPESTWLQDALLSAGNMYMLRNEFDKAIPFYAELYQRWRNGKFGTAPHWKCAWLNYRLGKKDDAKRLMEEHIEWYPGANEIPAALYWRGRLAEEDNDKPLARAYYKKLTSNFRYFYYAYLAHARLDAMDQGLQAGDPPPPSEKELLLNKLPRPAAPPQDWNAPEDNLRLKKAQLLANGALYDFAVKEMQATTNGTPPWLAKSLSELYLGQGSYIHSIETLKRTVPSYFSSEIPQIPRPVWEGLFPRPFWEELKKDSQQNHLDPYLIASLIRQESEFNPAAVSPANAMGLMQLLPSVGKHLAKEMKIKLASTDDLLTANTNLQLGTRYFKKVVDHYDGQVEYALAAYNAGEERVNDWRRNGNFKDVAEFVESIPFTETREYVQAIMRNTAMYKLLYPKG